MTEAARLVLISDTTSLKQGERDLDSLARTGSRVEGTLTINAKSIEQAMANIGKTMGGLDRTMQSLEAAVSKSMGRVAQQTQKSARSFDDLRRAIDPAYAASQRFAEVQRELAGMVASGSAAQDQANQVLEIARSRYLGIATAAEAAEQAQREQAQAVALATGSYEQLRASIDPIYATSKRYEAAVETLNQAMALGVINDKDRARTLQLLETQMIATNRQATAVGAATGKMSMAFNNASFQVQDFFVQIAAGTNAMQALSMQLPQFLGSLGFAGKLAMWGAGLGTLVAVGSVVVPMLMKAGKEAKITEDAITDLTGSLDSYRSAVTNALMPMDELWKKFGQGATAAREVYAAMVEIERIQYFQEMQTAVASLTGDLKGITQAVNDWQAATKLPDFLREEAIMGANRAAQSLAASFGISVLEAHRVAKAIQSFEAASDAGPREAAAASRALGDQLMRAYEASGRTNASLLSSADQAYQFSISAHEAARALGNADAAAAGAAVSTDNWAMAMAGVRSEILGIVSALSQIGGGMISNAAKFVEINALKAGKSVADARVEMEKFNVAAKYDGEIMAAEARGGILGWTEAQALKAAKALEMSGIAATSEADALRATAAEAERAAASKGRSGGASKAAAKEADKLAQSLDREAAQWRDLLDPMSRYKRDAAELAKLTGILSKSEMAEAQRKLNVELADSIPLAGEFVDITTTGMLNKFDGTLDSITAMFKRWLAQMIATAAKSRIMISMGMGGFGGMMGGGDALTSALGAAGAPVGGAGGVMGGLMGGLSAFGGGLWSGAGSVVSGVMGGGLSGGIGAIGSALGGVGSGMAGLGAAIGAVALPIAAVAAVLSFFKTKTKQLDAGLRVTIDGMDALTETFEKVEKKKFWGLSKKVRTYYDDADSETQRAVESAINGLQAGIVSAADALGFGAKTFADFSHSLQISTKGMSDEDAQKALMEAIGGVSDAYAEMIPGLMRFAKEGETASQALTRLSQSLVGVNGIMDTLGHKFRAAGLKGAALASDIAALFGGLEGMAQATQRYYEIFYSEAERLATTTRQTRAALADLGIAMPKTRAEYRAIIEALDLTTEKGRKTYAALIGMAGAMDQILPKAAEFTAQMEKLQNRIVTQIGAVIGHLNDAIRANQAAAADWRKAGDGIRDYLDKLRGTASALVSPIQARAYNKALYGRTLQAAQAGDVEAAGRLTGSASNYLGSVNDTAKSRVEAALAQARVAVQLGKVATRTDATAVALEKVAELQQKQVDILTKVQEHIAAGNSLTKEGITKLLGQLGGLDERIALRAEDAGTIVAGFSSALQGTRVQANVNATVNATATITGASALQTAMGNLRGSLVDLRAAIVAEEKRKADAVDAATGAVNTPPPAPAPVPAAPTPAPKAYTLADYSLRSYQTGGSNGMGDRTVVKGPLGGSKSFTHHLGNSLAVARRWLAANNYPAFALGGSHMGGIRLVGEQGPELEATGPSRIYSNSQTQKMLDNREVVAELRALRTEVEDMKAFARKTAESTTSTSRDMQRGFAVGFPTIPAEE